MAKAKLKNRRAYCKRKGHDRTDFGMDMDMIPNLEDDDGQGTGSDDNDMAREGGDEE